MTFLAASVWVAFAGLAWIFLLYPGLVVMVSRLSAIRTLHLDGPPHPTVTVLIVVQDEASQIDERIANLLEQNYPAERLRIVIASDGSRDDTAIRARRWVSERVTVHEMLQARGKPAVLAELVPQLADEIIVFTDARQRFEPSAVRALVAPLRDGRVGAVSGELVLDDEGDTPAGRGVGFYWRYEKWIREAESRIDSTVGVTGAVWALRKELFEPPPADTILDDVLLPLRTVRSGHRVLFEPRARAHDRVCATASQELERKIRTICGNFQLFSRERWLLSPWQNRLWVQTISHKLLRLVAPLLLATLFVSSLALAMAPTYAALAAAQVVFYGVALLARQRQRRGLRAPLAAIPYAFCLLNWATVRAFIRFVKKSQPVTWKRTGLRPT